MKKTRLLLLSVVLFLVVGACSVQEELRLSGDGSGSATLDISIHPIMAQYYNDLLIAMTGTEGEFPLFDVEQIEKSFAERDGIDLTGVSQRSRTQLTVELAFPDINAAFVAEDGQTPVLAFSRSGRRRTVEIRLDREAVDRFISFAPPETANMTEFLFPPVDGSVSREEFRDQMAWALEEYADPATVAKVLDEAAITVVVKPEGRVISQTGGRVHGSNVVFTVPILEILTLTGERVYSVTFEP